MHAQAGSAAPLSDQTLKHVYAKVYPLVESFVTYMGGQTADAQDVLQEAMIVYVQKTEMEDFDLQVSPSAYVTAVAKNVWVKYRQRDYGHLRFDREKEMSSAVVEADALQDIEVGERGRFMARMIAQLEPDCRQLLLYYYDEQLTLQEIAQRMNYASVQVVKNKKRRCLDLLRELIIQSTSPNKNERKK